MKSNQEYKNASLAALKGHWAPAVVAAIVYMAVALCYSAISSSVNPESSSMSLYSVVMSVAMCLAVFVVYPMGVGYYNAHRKFLLDGDDNFTANSFRIAFGRWIRNVGGIFLMGLFIFLWTLLFIIPGLVKAFAYAMTPFILVDKPEIGVNEAIDLSQKMMKGHKFELFYFSMSFFGWILLSCLTLGIGLLWLMPYMCTAMAAWYEDLKAEDEAKSGMIS